MAEGRTNSLHVIEYGQRVKGARRCFQFVGRAVLVEYDISGSTSENGDRDARTELLLCPRLVSCASNYTAVPHPEQQPTFSMHE